LVVYGLPKFGEEEEEEEEEIIVRLKERHVILKKVESQDDRLGWQEGSCDQLRDGSSLVSA
jgi:hypothetical protein